MKSSRLSSATPEDVLDIIARGYLDQYPPSVRAAACRLVGENSHDIWGYLSARDTKQRGYIDPLARCASQFFDFAVSSYDYATRAPTLWDTKSRSQQTAWLDQIFKTTAKLTKLLDEGPLAPSDVRSLECIPLSSLGKFLRDLGVPLADDDRFRLIQDKIRGHGMFARAPLDTAKRRRDGIPIDVDDVNAASNASNCDIRYTLDMMLNEIDFAAREKQLLSKPREIKSDRARFIVRLSRYCHGYFGIDCPLAVTVATRIMFDDDTVTERLVGRLVKRAKSKLGGNVIKKAKKTLPTA